MMSWQSLPSILALGTGALLLAGVLCRIALGRLRTRRWLLFAAVVLVHFGLFLTAGQIPVQRVPHTEEEDWAEVDLDDFLPPPPGEFLPPEKASEVLARLQHQPPAPPSPAGAEGEGLASAPATDSPSESLQTSLSLSDLIVVSRQVEQVAAGARKTVGQAGGVLSQFYGRMRELSNQAEIFRIKSRGQRVVFIIDRSGSMRGKPFATAKLQLLECLRKKPIGTRYQVCFFTDETLWLGGKAKPEWLTRDSDTMQYLTKEFAGIDVEGSTDPMPALREALAMKPEPPDEIFFLTDDDLYDSTPEHLDEVTRLNTNQAAIHAILLADQVKPGSWAVRLVQRNKGKEGKGAFRLVKINSATP